MKSFYFFMSFLFFSSLCFSQADLIQAPIPTGFSAVENPLFGGDNLVSNYRPIGPIAIIQKHNPSILIIAVNDTLATSNLGILIYSSTNNGQNWNLNSLGLTIRHKIERIRLVRTGLDSIYCVFVFNDIVRIWNVYNAAMAYHDSTNVRTFDIVGSSTGALYLFTDHLGTNNIRRFGSINGGWSWIQSGYVTSAGAFPTMCMSETGDTLFMNFYGTPYGSDTTTAKIRVARYRETSPGYLGSTGFQDVTTDPLPKHQFGSAAGYGKVWFFYTLGSSAIDIKCRVSSDAGTTYGTVFDVAANPNVDEYWFDTRMWAGGVDFSYYSDSLQSGTPTNNTDKLMSTYANASTPSTFTGLQQISNHPPGWSSAGYIPQIVEYAYYGFVWVGLDAPSNWRLYFDGSNITTSLKNKGNVTPGTFALYQNYPNPFNPSTKINFDIPRNGFVTLKVYNLLGKEVQTLVSRDLTAGSYSYYFNASKLTSGVYFYILESNGYTDVKKMILVK